MKSSYEEQWGLTDRSQSSSAKANKGASPREGAGTPNKEQVAGANNKKANRVSFTPPSNSGSTSGKESGGGKASGLGIQANVGSTSGDGPQSGESSSAGPAGQKPSAPSQKSMTKAQRRELQEKQRAEKATRVSAGLPAPGKKSAQATAQPNSGFSPNPSKSLATSFPGAEAEKAIAAAESGQTKKRERVTKEMGLFAHLDPPKFAHTASAPKDLHPAVVNVGLQMAQFKICGANARCVATLNAFRKVRLSMARFAGVC